MHSSGGTWCACAIKGHVTIGTLPCNVIDHARGLVSTETIAGIDSIKVSID